MISKHHPKQRFFHHSIQVDIFDLMFHGIFAATFADIFGDIFADFCCNFCWFLLMFADIFDDFCWFLLMFADIFDDFCWFLMIFADMFACGIIHSIPKVDPLPNSRSGPLTEGRDVGGVAARGPPPQTSPGNSWSFNPLNIQKTLGNHHFLWVNQLFLWPCSIGKFTITMGKSPCLMGKSACLMSKSPYWMENHWLTMEITMFNGKINDFDWAMASMANCECLPGRVKKLKSFAHGEKCGKNRRVSDWIFRSTNPLPKRHTKWWSKGVADTAYPVTSQNPAKC